VANFYQTILSHQSKGNKQIAVLVDPDKLSLKGLDAFAKRLNQSVIDYIFVGGSLLAIDSLETVIKTLKKHTQKPIIIFPGSNWHLSEEADALLLLSLVSGRNPDLLIGKHVEIAPILKQKKIEILSTAYVLIDGGKDTTVSYISNTKPIPADKPQLAAATAIAAEMIGMKCTYLDAGSGANNPVSNEMIASVAKHTNTPLIVGGGIRSIDKITKAHQAGADIVVIGNYIEEHPNFLTQINNELK